MLTYDSYFIGKSQDNIKTPEQRNRKEEILLAKEDSEEFSVDTFFEKKWERKRTHHSPDEAHQKPRRKSNWK